MSKSPRDTHGPVVKTGPTRGENRSRNNDGRWREKRSDAGQLRDKGGKSGCFLTTAACEMRSLPDNCYELTILREFRDEVLLATPSGKALVEEYYALAPSLVPLVRTSGWGDAVWRAIQETVAAIEAGDNQRATAIYQDLVLRLVNCRR